MVGFGALLTLFNKPNVMLGVVLYQLHQMRQDVFLNHSTRSGTLSPIPLEELLCGFHSTYQRGLFHDTHEDDNLEHVSSNGEYGDIQSLL